MRKGAFRGVFCLMYLFLALSLCGCADTELLTDILQTAAVETEVEHYSSETKEEAIENAVQTESQEEENVVETHNFLYDEASCFTYHNLNEAEAVWYQDIAQCLGLMQQEIRLDHVGIEQGLDETDIDRIFQCVLMDHPELFYVEGYTYTKYNRGDKIVAIKFSGTYSMDMEQALTRNAEIEEKADVLLAGASGLTTDYDKVKYVYETLICNTEYDLESPDNQNIYSVFVNNESVCQGYAKAVQYLLERMGVECALVQGTVDTGEGHAWNLVKVDGSYYYVDATWGDASYKSDEEESFYGYVPEISYDYLCITTEQLLRTHILDSYVPMPECVDEKDNYYVRENALFTTYDQEQMQNLFDRFLSEKKPDVTVKCADIECYQQLCTALIDEQDIFDYLKDDSYTVLYTLNEKQLSMTFWVTNE